MKQMTSLVSLMALTLLATFITFNAYAVMKSNWALESAGHVKSVGVLVYEDADCTTPLTSIDWGWLNSPSSNSHLAYVKNGGNYPVTLSMVINSTSPTWFDTYLTPGWNASGVNLNPDDVAPILLTLNVAPDCPGGSFSYDTTIIGTTVD